MSNIVEADYTIIQERTLPVIIAEIHIIEQNVAKTALEGAVRIGARLQEAKEKVGHGGFEQWCQENLNYSKRTAENFMKVAKEYGSENGLDSKAQALADFSITKALSLLKVPEEDRETFLEEHDVAGMTTRELEEAVRAANEERDIALAEAKAAADAAEKLTKDLAKEDTKLQKTQAKLDKVNNQLKKEQESRQSEIDLAVEKKRDELQKEAETKAGKVLQKAEAERKNLQEENESLKRRLSNAGNESIVKFKILVDQLQDIFDQAGQCIMVEQDQDRADRMNAALRQVVDKFREEL